MKLNLRTILIIVIMITSLSVVYQNILVQIGLLIISIFLLMIIQPSKHKLLRVLHRLKNIAKIILTLMIFQVLFRRAGEIYWQWGIIQITSVGLNYGIVSSLRFFLIIIIAGLLFDIPYYDYLLAFHSWKIPYEISFLVASVIYFIPIFASQFQRSNEALLLRGIDLKKLPIIKRFKAYLTLLFPILARAIAQVRYRAISLELRAFRLYNERTFLYEAKLRWFDYVIQIFIFTFFLLVLITL